MIFTILPLTGIIVNMVADTNGDFLFYFLVIDDDDKTDIKILRTPLSDARLSC